ncbi:acetyltransferase, partial [Tothia fuscella]
MENGELYLAFTPDLLAERRRSELACDRFNSAGDVSRRKRVQLWRDIVGDNTPLPPVIANAEQDEALFEEEPYVLPPVRVDYGTNTHVGAGAFINFNCCILDTCNVTIGARTLFGPNVSLFSATHPLDPVVRNGTKGPELGLPITIGEDCWIGGNVTICPGVVLGRGCVVGAGSINVPDFSVVAGNPARVIRRIETTMDP